MAIHFGSALDSVLARGIAHPAGVTAAVQSRKMVDGKLTPMVTEKRNVTKHSVTRNANVTQQAARVTDVTEPMSNAERQKAYRERKAAKKAARTDK